MFPERYPKTPWGYPLTDLRAQGTPELQIHSGRSVLVGLHVRGTGEAHLLAVREVDGWPVTALIADAGLPADRAAVDLRNFEN